MRAGLTQRLAFLRRHPPFDQMATPDLEVLARRLRPVRFADGDVVTEPAAGRAEWFYVLERGRIVLPETGAELGPGECFPIGSLAAHRPVRDRRLAVGEVTCLAMDRAGFEALRAASPQFAEFSRHRLSDLLERVGRMARVEAGRALGTDRALGVPLADRPMRPPVTTAPDTPVREVLGVLAEEGIGSIVVVDAENRPVGIFTLKDLLHRVALPGRGQDGPISEVMTPAPIGVKRSAFAFEAAMAMADNGIQHVLVVSEDGRVTGVVSERDLFALQRVGLADLSRALGRAGSVAALARLAGDVHVLVSELIAHGVKVGQVTRLISGLNDRLTVRVIELALAEAEGARDVPFTWVAFGSEGRQEQTLKTDQDNGILFEPPGGMAPEAARAALMAFAARVNDALAECGFPLCPGGIMARNPDCCLTAAEWEARFARWIDGGTPEHLMKAAIFFDFRALHGPAAPVEALRTRLLVRTADNGRFRKQMAANALQNAPPLGLFRDFRLSGSGAEAGTIDLKLNGVTPFIDAARILALANRIPETNTAARLEAAAAAGALAADDVAAWIGAYDFVRLLRMRLNREQALAGLPLGNRIDPDGLNDLDRRVLREAFREARELQGRLALDYQL